MRRSFLTLLALLAATAAHAQVGAGNGNGNSGPGNGNGNGNGSNNAVTANAAAGSSNVILRERRNTPGVLAPGLAAAGVESCLGSASVGGAGPGFGVTIGGTMTDKGCNLRLYARTLYSLGHTVAATQILCNDPDVALALAAEGVRCLTGPGVEAQRAVAAPASGTDATVADMDLEVRSEPEDILPRASRRRGRTRTEAGH